MIPKVIHYTWFSGELFPEKVQKCLDSWKVHLSDYEFRLWDMDSVKSIDSIFLKEALTERMWAYAADFVRLYALYHEGGIYLDTDVMVYKSFDSLLDKQAFIGKENSIHFEGGFSAQYLTSHCFGAVRNHPYIKNCLDYYDNRHFITSLHEDLPQPLKQNMVLLPFIQAEIARQYGYDWKPSNQEIQKCKTGLEIFPSEYFDTQKSSIYSYCKHMALGSWRNEKAQEPVYNLAYKIKWRLLCPIKWLLSKMNFIAIEIQ